MSLYCMKCHKWATNKAHPCNTENLISATKNMLPVALKVDSLGLQVASAFCLTEKHNHRVSIEAGVYFKCIYPDALLQDLPSSWYWSDYITLERKVICSCLSYESEYIATGEVSIDEFVESVINDLLDYLDTKDSNGLRAIILLSSD